MMINIDKKTLTRGALHFCAGAALGYVLIHAYKYWSKRIKKTSSKLEEDINENLNDQTDNNTNNNTNYDTNNLNNQSADVIQM